LEILIGRVLFWGGLASILIIVLGFSLHLFRGAAAMDEAMIRALMDTGTGAGAPGAFVSDAQILEGLRRPADPLAIVAFGLVLLLATPVAAVLVSLPALIRMRDFCYLTISLFILAILAAGYLFS
jgi:uncharacterized membrane protein